MSEYNAYGELYDQRPELVIHERFKHFGSTFELVALAKQNNYKINFSREPLRHDLVINWHEDDGVKTQSHTMSSGLRFFKRISQ